MNLRRLATAIFEEWNRISAAAPQERLPKEAQTQCIAYSALRSLFETVCVERGYGPVDDGNRAECDLWAAMPGRPETFIEIKHAWSSSSLNNKPSEQIASWMSDVAKLEGLPLDSDRYFVLVGFFEGDPLQVVTPGACSVIAGIQRLHPSRLVHRDSATFCWRQQRITHIALWAWHWPSGTGVESLARV
jgi:hypothetical protein